MKRIIFYFIFENKRYRFTAPDNMDVSYVEVLLRKRFKIQSCYRIKRSEYSSESKLLDGDTFEIEATSIDPITIEPAVLYGPPSVLGIDNDDESQSWD